MPHCELHYSDDLGIDAHSLLVEIERVVNEHDPSARECKGRLPNWYLHRPHLKVTIYMLTRPYRNAAFTDIDGRLEAYIKARITKSCYFSLVIEYSPEYYVTNEHVLGEDELVRYPQW